MASQYQKEYRELISLLVKARKDAGITQQELAKSLKKPQSFVSKYESCERRLDIIEFVQVAKFIGCDYKKMLSKVIA
ncbi:MAG: helix-turn-helix domain-containing protein [Alphaproteobacteria bacterium]|nr:helix-turn-helix domain-containing protein [Alphaproteobacteria bacterium]